ncbi:hypothetical protein E8E13_006938 [Curvularia kusanoi]|uniref:Nuclear condensin complex subunit 3 C-terminal domain-containing protein n=1 Tax=Curvularia kusanoi TaxID=90978 RepID=A0A9P4TND6_CURKU|nr:hypothetical protein E8E13_006938 [Curvularia kusanoi]
MPGRTTTRTARTTRAGAGTRSARSSAIEIPDEGDTTSLRNRIVQVFKDAQKTTATQRKLVVTLRKIQEEVCFEPPAHKARNAREEEDVEDFDEADFNQEFVRNVLRVANVKKSEPAGDRMVRFMATFLRYASEKDQKNAEAAGEDPNEQSPTSRLSTQILSTILRLFEAKDKTIRFRAVQIVTQLVNSVEQIDTELYTFLRLSLLKRLRDKEPSVRVQAVMGLGRLSGEDDEEDEDEDSDDEAGTIVDKLLHQLANDPDPQVRRTILINIPKWPSTGKYQLERARDVDPATRRIIYTRILPELPDFRHLSLELREKMIRWGLKDRDDIVRKAAARLFYERWIEDCASRRDTRPEEEKVPGSTAPPSREALCELLERLDIVHTGAEEGMAHTAMKEFWAGRPDYREAIEFDKDFWLELDPPAAFVMRSLNDYCQDADDDRMLALIEDKLPEITNFAHILQRQINNTTAAINRLAEMEDDDPEFDDAQEIAEDAEFVAEQLLHVALTLDYSDELGRRAMYNLMRGAIAHPVLPEECTKLAIDVLRITCGKRGEADFSALVMEAIQEVRDSLLDAEDDDTTGLGDDAQSFHSAQSETSSPPPESRKAQKPAKILTPEEEEANQQREILTYSKCLHIVHMLNTLIVPAVPSKEPIIRERGVICLGLATLLDQNLAAENLQLFFYCFNKGNDSLKEIVLQILGDVFVTWPQLLAPPPADPDTTEQSEAPEENQWLRPLSKVLRKGFASENMRVSSIACEAAQKLVLPNLLPPETTEEIVEAFTILYFDPEASSKKKPAVTQALSYFMPVFCHSKIRNAQLMANIAVSVVSKLLSMREDIVEEEVEAEMVGWPVITGHLSDWTDGRKVFGQTTVGTDGKTTLSAESELPHLVLAINILERALTSTCSKEERKPLLSLLTKLHVSPTAPKNLSPEATNNELLGTLQGLVAEAVEDHLGVDATQRNALAKLDATLSKRIGDAANATVAQEDREDTVTPSETANPRASIARSSVARSSVSRASVAPSVDGSEMDVDDDDDDTMLAGMQGEGTRMPLEADDSDDDDGESTPRASTVRRTTEPAEKTEADIMDELLASDDEMTM